jgi:type II secretory pathway component PulF
MVIVGLLAFVCAIAAAICIVLMEYGTPKHQDLPMNLGLTFGAFALLFWAIGFWGHAHAGLAILALVVIVIGTWIVVALIKPRHDRHLANPSKS